jgi:hypothetical protein
VLKGGAALVATLLAAVLIGCGGDDEEPKQESGSGAAQTSTATETATTPSGDTREAPAEPLAERDGSVDQKPVKLEILELKRSGETVALTFRLVAIGDTSGAQVASTFDDGIFQKLDGTTDTTAGAGSLDGISLIDATNRKRHLVGRDEDGACVCDRDLSNGFVSADAPLLLSATFAAPPDDIEAMDVVVPHFGTFKDVPVS